MAFDGSEFQERFKSAFGIDAKDVTVEQAWLLVRFAKNARLRCRNNKALYNSMMRNFPNLSFRDGPKEKANGAKYDGLFITDKRTGKIVDQKDDED